MTASPLLARLDAAADHVRGRTPLRPQIGVVLGSGLGAFADSLEDAVAVPYGDVPHFPTSTVVGHQGALVVGRCRGVPVAAMKGRVHFYEGYPLGEVVFPVRVLGRLGVTTLVVTNAAGAINPSFAPGDLMVIEDHLNLLGNPLLGPNEDALGPRFPDMSEAYDRGLRDVAEAGCRAASIPCHRGVYVGLTGPSYETPAEIRMLRAMGADAVGMSTVPDVIAARHMGIRVAGLSCLTNMAAGVSDAPLDHRDVLETGERVKAALLEVLARVVTEAARQA
ncbi:MAG TPA: purine-nucleoside phosphorylase [Vicinamibacteria bacterium]